MKILIGEASVRLVDFGDEGGPGNPVSGEFVCDEKIPEVSGSRPMKVESLTIRNDDSTVFNAGPGWIWAMGIIAAQSCGGALRMQYRYRFAISVMLEA